MAETSSLGSRVRETPVLEFVRVGETVAVVKMKLEKVGLGVKVSFRGVPVTRVGRSLPDWPEALSLRPDLGKRGN